jgi:serine/threonine protein kinase
MAPEILINRVNQEESTKIDVYSFGIIMHEVFFESLPYRTNDEQFESIIALGTKVVNGLRPNVPENIVQDVSEAEKLYLELMKECWSGNTQDRPSFEEIYSRFVAMQEIRS